MQLIVVIMKPWHWLMQRSFRLLLIHFLPILVVGCVVLPDNQRTTEGTIVGKVPSVLCTWASPSHRHTQLCIFIHSKMTLSSTRCSTMCVLGCWVLQPCACVCADPWSSGEKKKGTPLICVIIDIRPHWCTQRQLLCLSLSHTNTHLLPSLEMFIWIFQRRRLARLSGFMNYRDGESVSAWRTRLKVFEELTSVCRPLAVEPGVRLGLEGAHRQVLPAGGIHSGLPSDGCHGWLVSCFCF